MGRIKQNRTVFKGVVFTYTVILISSRSPAFSSNRAVVKNQSETGQTQSISQLVDQKKEAKELDKAFKLLNTEQSMRQTLDCKMSKMYIDALNDECLPILCRVDKFYEFLVGVDNEAALERSIKSKLEEHLSSGYLEELTSLLTGVLRSVLKRSTKQEVQQTHVVYANKSIVRIDYYLHFDASIEEVKNLLLYYIQVGVIDIAKARLPVLMYELTRATKGEKLKDAGKELKRRADDTVQLFDAVQTLAKAARLEKRPTSDSTDDSPPDSDQPDQTRSPVAIRTRRT